MTQQSTSQNISETVSPKLNLGKYYWFAHFWISFWIFTSALYVFLQIGHFFANIFDKENHGRFSHWVACVWARWSIAVMPIWDIEIEGLENIPKKNKAHVIVSNHQSMCDIWAIYYMGMQFRWLSKASVFKLPLCGTAMKKCGYVSITRGDRNSHKVAIEKSADILTKGLSMLFFPEGSRTRDGIMGEFKSGAFSLAQDSMVPLLPVSIIGAAEMMKPDSFYPNPARIRIRVLKPIAYDDFKDMEDLSPIIKTVRDTISDNVGQMQKDRDTGKDHGTMGSNR